MIYKIICSMILATPFMILFIGMLQQHQKTIEWKHKLELVDSDIKMTAARISYTRDILDFIRGFSIDNASLAFNEFSASKKLERVNRTILTKFISEVANETKESLSLYDIDYDMMIVNKKYIDRLLVDCTIYSIKKQFEDTIGEEIDLENVE